MQCQYLTGLLEVQGFQVIDVKRTERKGRRAVIVYLERSCKEYRCGECGALLRTAYDSTEQEVQHLMLWSHLTYVNFLRCRVNCPTCGIRTEALDFVALRRPRLTKALAALVAERCKMMSNQAVAVLQGLHRHTVKAIDKAALKAVQAQRPLDGITVLRVDFDRRGSRPYLLDARES
ncbi:MAG: hypothetical protein COS95_04770 [Ignavibacteriales bacterium CG07_land_8_20_14_0_80_59_12]|nr:MAG: hypothetical protein COS95_04770 [Ignavibacteriales bacterium CG07_land_8_20_14_0_80_59_12]